MVYSLSPNPPAVCRRPPQALSEAQDPFSDVLDDDDEGHSPRSNLDTYWSEQDRRVIAPCRGLMKAAAACLRKLAAAVRANGDSGGAQNVAQLDDLADISKEISPGCVITRARTHTCTHAVLKVNRFSWCQITECKLYRSGLQPGVRNP